MHKKTMPKQNIFTIIPYHILLFANNINILTLQTRGQTALISIYKHELWYFIYENILNVRVYYVYSKNSSEHFKRKFLLK